LTVACFLWENIITQHKLFNRLICNDESENKMWIKDLTDLYRIDCIVMSAYNLDVNNMMKCEHKFLIDELTKITNEDLEKWMNLLFLIFWTNQITICRSINKILYELLYEYSCVLLIEVHISTWSIIVWHKVKIQFNFLVICAQQLLHCDTDLKEAVLHFQCTWQQEKKYMNEFQNAKNQSYMIKDFVLLYNNRYKNDNITEWKLKFWWLDSYKIVKTNLKKSNYNIVKLNNTEKSETVLKSKLKLYFLRCNTMLHDYQQKINAQLDADSDFNIDFDNDYVQCDSFASLIDCWTHIIKDNTEYIDSDNSWHFSCRLLFAET